MLKNFWKNYLKQAGRDENAAYAWSICFGMDREGANSAAERVCSGEKTAMIYPAEGYRANMNRALEAGDCVIVCDWLEQPKAVVEVLRVENIAMNMLSDAQIAMEAEAQDMEDWKNRRMPAVKTEIEETGGEFAEDARLVFVEFRTAYTGA